MRVGVLTLPFNNNYGGYLQYIALKTTLEKLGHTVVMINRRQNGFERSITQQIKSFVHYHFLRHKNRVYNRATYEKRHAEIGSNILRDVSKYLYPSTHPIYTTKEFADLQDQFDSIIVGSDQVWRPLYVPDVREFFLNFAEGWQVKRISYAASFGTETPEYTPKLIAECGRLLAKFDAISLREQSSVPLVKDLFGIDKALVASVLDPTMLLTADDYRAMFNLPERSQQRCFTYFLDSSPEKRLAAERYATENNLSITHHDCKSIPLMSMRDWLDGISNSAMVFTDSFHGTVFSVIFHTPFYTFDNSGRGSMRLKDLLQPLGLGDRMVKPDQTDITKNQIDWCGVMQKLDKSREDSRSYLEQSLA